MEARISPENMITFLLTTPMFADLDPHEIKDIIHIVEVQKFSAGDVVFSEGEAGTAWYALYSGAVNVIKKSNGGQQIIRILEPGSSFGEIAVLDNLPRSATISAAEDSVVLRIPQDKFNDLLARENPIAFKLIHNMALMLASRQRANTDSLSKLLQASEISTIQDGIREIVGDSSMRE